MQQTETYKLKLIEPDDTFNADALNDNAKTLEAQLARVDAAIATIPKFACGTYTGNGKNGHKISLPFTPKMVYVGDDRGYCSFYSNSANYRGGVALEGKPVNVSSTILVEIVEGGFQVADYSVYTCANYSGREYRYFAIG